MKTLILSIVLLNIGCSGATSNPLICGSQTVNSGLDSTEELQDCFDAGISINLLPGTYLIGSTLVISNRHNLTISTKGVNSGPACLEPGASDCAILKASNTNKGPVILNASTNIGLSLNHIALDGNKAERRANYKNTDWTSGRAYNALMLDCSGCSFKGLTSINAAQGTGMGFSGDNAVFDMVSFRNNGYGMPNYIADAAWSDGLTIGSARNIVIKNSIFVDNSDVDLILGNAPGAIVENNVIGNTTNFAFAGLMLNTFALTSSHDYSGAEFRNNQVLCPNGACGIGIMVGPGFWDSSLPAVINGSVHDNIVSGAKFGIMINGAMYTKVYNNTISVDGIYTSYGCTSAPLSAVNSSADAHDNSSPLVIGDYHLCGPNTLPIMSL